ncbi:MAG TPA: tyrosine-type recombinase/integrase [Miltoncostaeaceae bacterium]|nr:tyrosine-type recombinase/integrase [Miltoncostaeaceae bacterium]
MTSADEPKRPRGTGSLWIRTGSNGSETWYGQFWLKDRTVRRALGPVHQRGKPGGLTRPAAERRLRELQMKETAAIPREQRITLREAAAAYLGHLETVKGRKPTTLAGYRASVDHLAQFTDGHSLDRITPRMLGQYIVAKLADGRSPKTLRNDLIFLGGLYKHAMRQGWTTENPVDGIDLPESREKTTELRFLTLEELQVLYRAAPTSADPEILRLFWSTDRVAIMAAAMLGVRRGELVALQWKDIDWTARLVRVRRSFTAGQLTTPKSRRSVRAVPLADALAQELERHYQRSPYQGDTDYVFAHYALGSILDPTALRRRFADALKRAGLRQVRFHDLRHTYGTAMAAAGAPMRSLMQWMGHATMQTTMIYADYSPDPTAGAAWAARAFTTDPVSSNVTSNRGNLTAPEGITDPITERVQPDS